MGTLNTNERWDEIRVRGVRCKGYGQLAKFAMLDPELTIQAKAVYAYFCSFTGVGNSCFPSRDTIIRELNLGKDRYYKSLSLLQACGYITIERSHGPGVNGFQHNIYTIEDFPSGFATRDTSGYSPLLLQSYKRIMSVKDLYAGGYGVVPKSIMQEPTISIEGKGIYSFLAVFSGENFESSPSLNTFTFYLRISYKSLRKYTEELTGKGLISKIQNSAEHGKFGNNIFHLVQNPNGNEHQTVNPSSKEKNNIPESFNPNKSQNITQSDISPLGKSPDILNKDIPPCKMAAAVLPFGKNPDILFPDVPNPTLPNPTLPNPTLPNPTLQNQDTIITSIITTNEEHNQFVYHPSIYQAKSFSEEERAIDFEKILTEVTHEILSEHALPFSYMYVPSKMIAAVRYLTDWDYRVSGSYYGLPAKEEEKQIKIYKLFCESLSEMLRAGNFTFVRGAKISSDRIYELVMENFFRTGEDEFFEEYAYLDEELTDSVISLFEESLNSRKIVNLKSYMKTIIWTVLQTAGIRSTL